MDLFHIKKTIAMVGWPSPGEDILFWLLLTVFLYWYVDTGVWED